MLTFKPVARGDISRLRRYYEHCTYQLCEYSALVKFMWRAHLHPSYAEAAGCLIVRNVIGGDYCFDYPVAGKDGDIDAALTAIEQWCMEQGVPLILSVVPEDKGVELLRRYPHLHVAAPRAWRDYIYDAEDMREFAGRRYSGQRNHINKFMKLYPEARFCVLGKEDLPRIEQFWRDYEEVFGKSGNDSARRELKYAQQSLRLVGSRHFFVGGMEHEGKLISLAMAERCGETLHVHIEKALYGYEGVYPMTVREFARAFAGSGVRYINREDDAGDKGLRTSKMQYLPAKLGVKLRFDVKNELEKVNDYPTIQTPRLTLSALTEADKSAYNALCLDDARNRWWGYDYRADWHGEPLEDYFLNVTREDFTRKTALNLAIRLDGKCIGEVLLYHFDFRGGAEIGCRIAPEYVHCGYGTEAFAALADWALYHLHANYVVAKCYRENDASYRMLSSCMKKNGEDETFYYFKKEV